MSSILEDFFRERNKKRGSDGAVDRFLNWQAGRPDDDGIAVRPEEYPENNPENTGPPIAVGPEDYPENDPSLEGTDPIDLTNYMKGAEQLLPPLAAQMPMPAQDPDEPPADMPLIQQLQQQPEMLGPGDDKQPVREPESQREYATMYPRPDEQLHPKKSPEQQQYGPNTGRQDELSTEYNSGPAASLLEGGFEGASTKDILEGKAPLTMDSLGLPDYDLPEFETGADGTVGTGWRDADLKPLPGEETLHPDILKWADTNKTAGGTGLQGLRQAYMNEVDAGATGEEEYIDNNGETQIRKVPGREQISFQEWLESKGFDPNNEMGYRGNREALNRIAPMPGLNGSDVDSHRARLRKQKVIGSYLRRYGDESVLQDPMSRAEAESIYDNAYSDALENGENPVLAAGRALHGYSQQFQQDKDAQLRQNVSNRASQMHRAQRFGVPVGLVAAVDQYRNAGNDPNKQQQALLMGAMQYPQIFLPIYQAQAYATNQASLIAGMNNSMPAGVGGQNPNMRGDVAVPEAGYDETTQGMQNALSFMTVNGFEPDAWIQAKTGSKWLDMTPEGQADFVGMKYSKQLDLIRKMIAKGETKAITPETKGMLRDMLGNPPDPALFNRAFGQLEEGEYENIVSVLYNQEPTTWRDVGEGVREGLGDLKDGVIDFFGGIFSG